MSLTPDTRLIDMTAADLVALMASAPKPSPIPQPSGVGWLASKEAARALCISMSTLKRWVREGVLTPSVINQSHYFALDDIRQALESRRRI